MSVPPIPAEPRYGILQYSNNWGHLIMSIVCIGVGVWLVYAGYFPLGGSLIGMSSAAWFIPGAAKQMAYEVQSLPATGVLPVPLAIHILPTIEHVQSSSVATSEGQPSVTTETSTVTTKAGNDAAVQPHS